MKPDERIAMLARIGYLARAILYFALGYLSLATGRAEGTTSVLSPLSRIPGGAALTAGLALGLAAYGLFRLYGAAIDIEADGDDAKGRVKRAGHALSAFAHFGLAYGAASLFAWGTQPRDGAAGRDATEVALGLPFGWALLIVAGLGFAAAAFAQAEKAWSAGFMRLLTRNAPHWSKVVGRIGYAARAAVFAGVAWALIDLGRSGRAGEVGFQDALAVYSDRSWLFAGVAGGLMLFGVFSLVMARYRDVCDTPLVRRFA
ncbi:hypothetical protein COC42_13140 [Sphingomonas spermidinifaciens]|uniref:DUF1206 domain-containing protein n=1 Tax=Sphingomonas spermidinifaciens TaxID=1141889 RepID=A0A2A4B1P9_9SPHN|nr:DUF1206 domain-containing protein [Sphingomonas spermidinifaciens]PCD02371.1 hypothetical protein COC42_13140 [Sphingomonas spermidinifaciens]